MSWFDKFKKAVNPARKTGGKSITGGTDNAAEEGKTGAAGTTGSAEKAGAAGKPEDAVNKNDIPRERENNQPHRKTGNDASSKRQALTRLSPREKTVFARSLEGMKMKDIASELQIKTSTVNGYCREIYKKLGVHSKAQLILEYLKYKDILF